MQSFGCKRYNDTTTMRSPKTLEWSARATHWIVYTTRSSWTRVWTGYGITSETTIPGISSETTETRESRVRLYGGATDRYSARREREPPMSGKSSWPEILYVAQLLRYGFLRSYGAEDLPQPGSDDAVYRNRRLIRDSGIVVSLVVPGIPSSHSWFPYFSPFFRKKFPENS